MVTRLRPLGAYGMGRLGDALVDSMAAAIQQMEGYIPPNAQYPKGSLAYINQNPGNLRFANQPGAVQGQGGFAAFPSYAAGYAALQNQIQYQINAGQNLTQFFNQYAPSIENNTPGYIAFVAQQTGIDPTVPLINYQNGSATIGASSTSSSSSSSSSTDSTGGSTSSTVDLSSLSDIGTSITDAISNADPTVLIVAGVIAAGVAYVLWG
jgi:hypothetical protein